ncbi:hypothetical protein [Glaciecola sp. 1036]|uniref:hypothetical protein n=1 Tax=Alteromonadaceae TaxID=72275 RepID=UPI003CFDDC04
METIVLLFSKVLFRLTFFAFVIIYGAVLAEFINPAYYQVNVNIDLEALVLTGIVAAYLYFFLRKRKH